jgi:hypothetical protein
VPGHQVEAQVGNVVPQDKGVDMLGLQHLCERLTQPPHEQANCQSFLSGKIGQPGA